MKVKLTYKHKDFEYAFSKIGIKHIQIDYNEILSGMTHTLLEYLKIDTMLGITECVVEEGALSFIFFPVGNSNADMETARSLFFENVIKFQNFMGDETT